MLRYVLCLILIPVAVLEGRSLIDQRVIGGSQVTDHTTVPFMLSLQYGNTHSCGAILVSSTKAITAAHCVGNAISQYRILAGTLDCTDCSGVCVSRRLNDTIRHPDYVNSGGAGYPNDIAVVTFLVILEAENPLNQEIQPIAIGDATTPINNAWIVGWGQTTVNAGVSSRLILADQISTLSADECSAEWPVNIDYTRQICAADNTGGRSRGPCNGDTGGPLITGTTALNRRLVGILSYAGPGCNTNYPGVFTRVQYYADWIENTP